MSDKGKNENRRRRVSGRAVPWLVILVLMLVVVQMGCQSNTGTTTGKTETTAPGSPGTEAPPEAGLPGPQSGPPPAAMGAGTAVKGTIRMDKLSYGLVKLEQGKSPLAPPQAKKILAIMDTLKNEFGKVDYLSSQVEKILTEPQKEFINQQVEAAAKKQMGMVNTIDVKIVSDKLRKTAGQGLTNKVEVPADFNPEPPKIVPGKPHVPWLFKLINCYSAIETNPKVAVTKDQAMKLLPIMNSYTPQASSTNQMQEIMGVLTQEQKTEIDTLAKSAPEDPKQMMEYPQKLTELLKSKAK